MKKIIKTAVIFIIASVIAVLFIINKTNEYTIKVDGALNTVSSVLIVGKNNVSGLTSKCKSEILKYDSMLSAYSKNSEIGRINCSDTSTQVSAETVDIISTCIDYYNETDKCFDITVGAVSELWDNVIQKNELPDAETVKSASELTDGSAISVDENVVIKKNSEQILTLGACAKGYISDRLSDIVKTEGVNGALVNLGGNIYAFGKKSDGKSWRVGIQNPDNAADTIGVLTIDDKFVITSGDYERYTEIDGKRYHHIIDPKTGYPAESGLRSVTVISDEGMKGDILSTALFVAGMEKGKKIADKYGVYAFFVTDDKKIYYNREAENIFEKNNTAYEYIPY